MAAKRWGAESYSQLGVPRPRNGTLSTLRAEVRVALASGLRRHEVGGALRVRQLKRDAERGTARSGAARVGAGAPVIADGDDVEGGQLARFAIDADRAEKVAFVAALGGLEVGVRCHDEGARQLEPHFGVADRFGDKLHLDL